VSQGQNPCLGPGIQKGILTLHTEVGPQAANKGNWCPPPTDTVSQGAKRKRMRLDNTDTGNSGKKKLLRGKETWGGHGGGRFGN